MKYYMTLFHIALFSILLMMMGCNESSGENNDEPLETKLVLRDSSGQESSQFAQDETIEFFLTLTNNTNENITLNFPTPHQYNFYINSPSNTQIWRSEIDYSYLDTSLTIPAGESIVLNDSLSTSIPEGHYTAFGGIINQSHKKFDFIVGDGNAPNNFNNEQLETKIVLKDSSGQESNQFAQGETIEFFLTLTNHSSEDITLNFTDGQQFDFYINHASGHLEIWRWSDNKAFIQALTDLTIPAGETIEISEFWNQILSDGEFTEYSSFTAFGGVLNQNQEKFDFIIQ